MCVCVRECVWVYMCVCVHMCMSMRGCVCAWWVCVCVCACRYRHSTCQCTSSPHLTLLSHTYTYIFIRLCVCVCLCLCLCVCKYRRLTYQHTSLLHGTCWNSPRWNRPISIYVKDTYIYAKKTCKSIETSLNWLSWNSSTCM